MPEIFLWVLKYSKTYNYQKPFNRLPRLRNRFEPQQSPQRPIRARSVPRHEQPAAAAPAPTRAGLQQPTVAAVAGQQQTRSRIPQRAVRTMRRSTSAPGDKPARITAAPAPWQEQPSRAAAAAQQQAPDLIPFSDRVRALNRAARLYFSNRNLLRQQQQQFQPAQRHLVDKSARSKMVMVFSRSKCRE